MKIDKIVLKELLKYHQDAANVSLKPLRNVSGYANENYKLSARTHERFVELLKSVENLVNEK